MRKILSKIPLLPVSALIFYLLIVLFWNLGIIPSPLEILNFLENLYEKFGLTGLFIASFLEGIVYLGLYFPGSFIIVFAVILSNGMIKSFLEISLVVAFALTLASIFNYVFGKYSIKKYKKDKSEEIASRGLFLSMLHPNSLAFYFFNAGIKNLNLVKIIFVPIVMIPYGFAIAVLIYSLKEFFKKTVESPLILTTIILLWLLVAFMLNVKTKEQI